MKKKEILKTIITIIVSVVLSSGISVYATSTYLYDSCDVSYDNTSSGLNATNVQSSLDELYMHATDYTELKNYFQNNPTSYFYGNDLRLGVNGSSTGGTWLNFYIDGVNRGGIGNEANGTMDIAAKDATGSNNTGRLNLIGKPVMINGTSVGDIIKTKNIRDNTVRTINAGTTGSIDFDITLSGYTPLGIVGITGSGTTGLAFIDQYLTSNINARIYYRNITSSSTTLNWIQITVLYIKTEI